MAPPVEISPPSGDEVKQLYALAKGVFAEMRGWDDERVLGTLERDVVFVAREEAEPAGYLALRRDPASASLVVEQLFVAPGHEQRGIGHRLLEYAEGYAIAQRMRALRIVVEEENPAARSFYHRSGFVDVEPEVLELVLPRA